MTIDGLWVHQDHSNAPFSPSPLLQSKVFFSFDATSRFALVLPVIHKPSLTLLTMMRKKNGKNEIRFFNGLGDAKATYVSVRF